MRNAFKRILSIILAVSMLLCTTVPTFAADGEVYISALRIVYADTYEEAKEILEDSEFSHYKLLKENLNEDSDEIGVWLAYETTTDIEDAITDLAIMQMNGGYTEGNFQEMVKKSYDEYVAMGEIYVEAIEYFAEAYEAKNFLAQVAYRQLNFYTSVTEEGLGIEIPYFDGELLGDIFLEGIEAGELATMFLEGNSYALNNIRALLAMGVSYNEDGKTYLEKVADAAAEMTSDPSVFDDEDYDDLAALVAPTISTLQNMFKELEAYEDDLNYEDDDFTDAELKYVEYMAMARMTREVQYLDDKTLYDFCMSYTASEDYTNLYPLVAALNAGQVAMTKVLHYYDVVRYSMKSAPEEYIEKELVKQEEVYLDNPFNIYTGVDRTIYRGTFALTSAASRADAYTDRNTLANTFFSGEYAVMTAIDILVGATGIGFMVWATIERGAESVALTNAIEKAVQGVQDKVTNAVNDLAGTFASGDGAVNNLWSNQTFNDLMNNFLSKNFASDPGLSNFSSMTFADKANFLATKKVADIVRLDDTSQAAYYKLTNSISKVKSDATPVGGEEAAKQAAQNAASTSAISGLLYVVGGAMMLYSAISMAMTVYHYYHPEYEDIPLALVDLIDTVDGDRYIKYDAVLEAETNDDGLYDAGDLNAFAGQRWNALYYTKSYEAGKPLLADEFVVSNSSNRPKTNYAPVHRFGEEVCYDLNKYNFEEGTHIYLSVKQSKNNKSAVADVPEIVGSMFGAGYIFLAGGIGALLGIGGTMLTNSVMKKKKAEAKSEA